MKQFIVLSKSNLKDISNNKALQVFINNIDEQDIIICSEEYYEQYEKYENGELE